MTNQDLGIKNFRRRLAFGIRDSVLMMLNKPQSFANMTGMPLSELGAIADMSDEQRQSVITVVARAMDTGCNHFLYGLDNQADGFEISYNGEKLNDEGLYLLSSPDLPPISEESLYDGDGREKQSQEQEPEQGMGGNGDSAGG